MAKKKRANAGEGYGFMFSGAFTEKKDAEKKERQRKGSFIKGMPTAHGYRYVVMTPRDNPRRRNNRVRAKFVYAATDQTGRRFTDWTQLKDYAIRQAKTYGGNLLEMNLDSGYERVAKRYAKAGKRYGFPGTPTAYGGYHENPMDLMVMGAGANPHSREISLNPGETITLRVNPSGRICGHMVGGLPCTREPGHKGPHLPQGATLRPSSRHNWGRGANPSAEVIREEFTGMPVASIDSYREPHMPAGNYALVGKLLMLAIKPPSGGQRFEINWKPREQRPRVVSDESARQIYFVGGDQYLSVEELVGWGARDLGGGRYELGEGREIHYHQHKAHAPDPGPRFKKDEWQHPFGQENGIRPKLFYDRNLNRIFVEGGDYRIEARGIVN